MKFIKYLKAWLVKIKYWYYTSWNGHIVYNRARNNYIIFCEKCHEYICSDGLCSNSMCPEEIRDIRE